MRFQTKNNCTTYFWECKKPQCVIIIWKFAASIHSLLNEMLNWGFTKAKASQLRCQMFESNNSISFTIYFQIVIYLQIDWLPLDFFILQNKYKDYGRLQKEALMHSTKSFYSTYVTPFYKGHRWRESKMCHLPCQTQQFFRLANSSVTRILYPFGIQQFFFYKVFKCVFCLAEYIHHYTGTIVLALKAVFLHGWAYFKVPVRLKSHMPGFFCVFGHEAGGKKVREGGVHVWMFVFLQEEGIGRLQWFLFPLKGRDWRKRELSWKSAWKKYTLNKASVKYV